MTLASRPANVDRIAVMYAGKIVETASTEAFISDSHHPYSRGLLPATPDIGRSTDRLASIPGAPPSLIDLPPGCHFHRAAPMPPTGAGPRRRG